MTDNYPPGRRPLSYHGDVDTTTRRSLLPQLGSGRYAIRQTSGTGNSDDTSTSKEGFGAASGKFSGDKNKNEGIEDAVKNNAVNGRLRSRSRPKSMYQNVASLDAIPTKGEGEKRAAEPSAGLARSQSLRRPTVNTQASSRVGSGHVRAKSGVVVPSTLQQRGLLVGASSTTSHSRSQSTALHPTTQDEPLKPKSSVQSASAGELIKPTSNLGRPKSLLVRPGLHAKAPISKSSFNYVGSRQAASLPESTRVAYTRAQQPLATQTQTREPIKDEPNKAPRPAFSTLQQHFTPRKVGKAPTSNFLHPPPLPSSTAALSLEMNSLQSELLTLHLLHETSADVNKQWELSAQQHMRKKFEEISRLHEAMLESEQAAQESKNVRALLNWNKEQASAGVIEYLQILSGLLHELTLLVEEGGRFQRLVAEFEQWRSRFENVQATQRLSGQANNFLASFEGLGDAWKAENALLTRKLTSFARDLEKVPSPISGSSVAQIIETCNALLSVLIDELATMQTIKSSVTAIEKRWVETHLQAIAQADAVDPVQAENEIPIWLI